MRTDRKTVLVVDDEAAVRLNLCAYLEDEGFAVLAAGDGEEALAILAKRQADVGVIDMRLPGIDGNGVIRAARRFCPDMKFLIHTGSASYQVPSNLRGVVSNEDQIFRKPIMDMSALVQGIHRLMSS